MCGFAAISLCAAFTSCSKSNDLFDESAAPNKQQTNEEKIVSSYEEAFKNAFGQPGANQDWGLSKYGSINNAGTRANAGKDYPSTSTGINANGNEWADPNKYYGGWLVPDPLTEGQIERVRKYFQANPNLDFKDPEWRHFFVQQVYKGGTAVGSNSTETITAANNSTYNSSHMNKLTVGQNNLHINNFNSGDCSVYGNVLDNGQTVNGGTTHPDKIQLMVNIDDTSCFGYYESGASIQVNNKAALVSAATIDAWAAANGNPGEAVVDKWNRSFMGFDHALKEGADALDAATVKYNDGPESYNYALVNGEVVSIDGNSEILINGKPIQYASTNTNMYVAAEKTNMSDGDIQAEYRVGNDYKGKYINVDNIMAKLNAGWIPVKDKNLREWVKIGTSDGYFSDWIVTLTKAERNIVYMGRIMGEDLTAEKDNDFDFNDVVFDWAISADKKTAYIKLYAAGGTLPLKIGTAVGEGQEVHALFGVSTSTMVNTGVGAVGITKAPVEFTITKTEGTFGSAADIIVSVDKTSKGANGYMQMTAKIGEAPCLLFIPLDTKWVDEYENIEKAYTWFGAWARGENGDQWTTAPVEKYTNLDLNDNK